MMKAPVPQHVAAREKVVILALRWAARSIGTCRIVCFGTPARRLEAASPAVRRRYCRRPIKMSPPTLHATVLDTACKVKLSLPSWAVCPSSARTLQRENASSL